MSNTTATATTAKPAIKVAIKVAKAKPKAKPPVITTTLPGGIIIMSARQAERAGAACANADIQGDVTKHSLVIQLARMNGDAVSQTRALDAAEKGYRAQYALKRPAATADAVDNATKQFASLLRSGVRILTGGRELPERVRVWSACGALLNGNGTLKSDKTESDYQAALNPVRIKPMAAEGAGDANKPRGGASGASGAPTGSPGASGNAKPDAKGGAHGDGENPFVPAAFAMHGAMVRGYLAQWAKMPGMPEKQLADFKALAHWLALGAKDG